MQPLHIVYLLVYIATGSAQSLVIRKSSQDNNGKQPYEPVAVTFAVELSKLMLSLSIIFFVQNREQSFRSKLQSLTSRWDTAKHFAVPAASYCIFNALAFYNLRLVTPPTYRLLINLKVLFSGLMLQLLIKTRLSKRQWLGLCLLVTACGVEQWDSFDVHTGFLAIVSICFQAFCSSFAGVYFQLLLQIRPQATAVAATSELGLWEKNFFMYCWTLFFNLFYLAFFAPHVLANPAAAVATFDAQVLPIIFLMGVGGVSTSLILRDMDVIVKEYANFAEMMCVVVCSYFFLGSAVHSSLFVAVSMVSVSLYLYNVPAAEDRAAAPVAYTAVATTGMDAKDIEMDTMDHDNDGLDK